MGSYGQIRKGWFLQMDGQSEKGKPARGRLSPQQDAGLGNSHLDSSNSASFMQCSKAAAMNLVNINVFRWSCFFFKVLYLQTDHLQCLIIPSIYLPQHLVPVPFTWDLNFPDLYLAHSFTSSRSPLRCHLLSVTSSTLTTILLPITLFPFLL